MSRTHPSRKDDHVQDSEFRQNDKHIIDWMSKFQADTETVQIYSVGNGKYGIVEQNTITPTNAGQPKVVKRTLLYCGIESAIEADYYAHFMIRTRAHVDAKEARNVVEGLVPEDPHDARQSVATGTAKPQIETEFIVVTIEDAVAENQMPRLDLYPETAVDASE